MTKRARTLDGFLIYALALGVRLVGIGYLLPHLVEYDAWCAVQVQILDGDVSAADTQVFYGRLIPGLALALRPVLVWLAPGAGLEQHLAAAASTPLACRLAVAALAALVAPATLAIASRFFTRPAAWLAGLLTTFSLLLVCFSQQGRPHGALAGTTAVGLWALLALRERWSVPRALAFALALCASIATLHSGLALLVPLAAAFALRSEPRARDALHLAATLALAWLAFRWSGLAFEHTATAGRSGVFLGRQVSLETLDGSGFAVVGSTLFGFEPVVSALGLVGLGLLGVRALRTRRPLGERARGVVILAAYGLPSLVAIGVFATSKARYVLPLLPLVALLATAAVVAVPSRRGLALRRAAFSLALCATALPTVKLVWLRTRPDTLERAASWVREHVRPGTEVVWMQPGLDLPLLQTRSALEHNPPESRQAHLYFWMRYQRRYEPHVPGEPAYELLLAPHVEELRAGLFAPVRLDDFRGERGGFVLAGRLHPGRPPPLLADLHAAGTPAASFAAFHDRRGRGMPLYDLRHGRRNWWDVLCATSVGPAVELIRVPPRSSRGPASGVGR